MVAVEWQGGQFMNAARGSSRMRTRRSGGQGLIEGTCGSVIVMSVFVAMTVLGVNVYSVMVNQSKVQKAADIAARIVNESRFWLGTYRNDFSASDARARAQFAADSVLNLMGLPSAEIVEFDPGTFIQDGTSGFVSTHIKLRVRALRMPYRTAGFPASLDMTADGYSAASSYTPYAACVMGFTAPSQADPFGRPNLGSTTRRIQVPVIGYDQQFPGGAVVPPSHGQGANGSAVRGGAYIGCETRCFGYADDLTRVDCSRPGAPSFRRLGW